MFETAERLTLAGIGALAVITERAGKMVHELAEKGKTKREELRNLFRELSDRGEQKKADLLCSLYRKINLKEDLSLATKEEIEELKERIARLEEQLSQK